MKKIFKSILGITMITALLTGCGASASSGNDSSKNSNATKIAVVRNLASGDHTQQFLAGCVEEGQKFGYQVDTFVTDGDDAKCQETVSQVISQNYAGIIVSHGQLSYSYEMLKPAADKGMKIVTFDTMPYENGDADGKLLEGVTSTAQNDQALADLSLGYMMEEFEANGGTYPIKVLKTFMGPGVPPLDRRNEIYTQLEKEGKIETVQIIAPSDMANVRGDMTTKTEAILPTLGQGKIDAIWGCYDELAKGVLQAMNDAGRKDIPMYTIDISNDDIQQMVKNPEIWKSAAAVDPKLIGTVNMRLIALKLAGEDTPEYFNLAANNIVTSELSSDTTMSDLGTIVEGWGDATSVEGSLYTEKIKSLYVK